MLARSILTLRRLVLPAFYGVATLFGATAQGGPLQVDITHGTQGVAYDASYEAVISDDTHATLTITVKNTTPDPPDGVLTAIAFNSPGDVVSSIVLDSSSFGQNTVFEPVNSTPGPYGTFDYGLSTGNGSWQGGSPNQGLDAGDIGVFVFNLQGSFSGLTDATLTQKFYESFSIGGDPNAIFAARFQRVDGSGSSVGASLEIHNAVPEPSSVVMVGMASLAGLVEYVRNRRRSAA
ncbi:hypothetical protein [Paludisphaera sp.]|uniref:hypothetical protein n=1 Tax=Paludisphaera sp. TaxID=2017432 RepID=UPI00301D6FB4